MNKIEIMEERLFAEAYDGGQDQPNAATTPFNAMHAVAFEKGLTPPTLSEGRFFPKLPRDAGPSGTEATQSAPPF
jgi:hypothetical protein